MGVAMNENREVLKRIVATLLALADLAERASVRSRPALCLVLWILRPAEAVARDFVIGASRDLGAPSLLSALALERPRPMAVGRGGERAADALRLALDFRMLATALDSLASMASARPRSFRHAALVELLSALKPGFASGRWPRSRSVESPARHAPSYPDTS